MILTAMTDKAQHTLLYVDLILLRRINEVTQHALGILSTVRGMKMFLGTALRFGVAQVQATIPSLYPGLWRTPRVLWQITSSGV